MVCSDRFKAVTSGYIRLHESHQGGELICSRHVSSQEHLLKQDCLLHKLLRQQGILQQVAASCSIA